MDDLTELLAIQQKMAQTVDRLQQDNARVTDWDWVFLPEKSSVNQKLKTYIPVRGTARKQYSLN